MEAWKRCAWERRQRPAQRCLTHKFPSIRRHYFRHDHVTRRGGTVVRQRAGVRVRATVTGLPLSSARPYLGRDALQACHPCLRRRPKAPSRRLVPRLDSKP
eukprot:352152-Chlamydomonas_euryale.AAC.1